MIIQLNGQTLDIDGITVETSFADLMTCVEQHAKQSGVTIMEIVVDGKSYAFEEAQGLGGKPLGTFDTINFTGATLKDMIKAAVFDHSEALDHAEGLMEKMANDLRLGDVKAAMENHVEFVDCLSWLSIMLDHLSKGFAEGMIESSLENQRVALAKQLLEKMGLLQSAQEKQDWVGMADVVEYEFPEVIKEARTLFRSLKVKE